MQDGPNAASLLDAVAQFLRRSVVPAVADPSVAFRVRIAASLAAMVSRELQAEEIHDRAELEGLARLLPAAGTDGSEALGRDERHEAIHAREDALARAIRLRTLKDEEYDAVFQQLMATLVHRLSIVNPRFDITDEVP